MYVEYIYVKLLCAEKEEKVYDIYFQISYFYYFKAVDHVFFYKLVINVNLPS